MPGTTEHDSNIEVNIDDLPLGEDRTRAWQSLRDAGEVVKSGNEFLLTSADACEFAAKRPDIFFSSARAFFQHLLGSPVPVVPLGIDPPGPCPFPPDIGPFFSPKKDERA